MASETATNYVAKADKAAASDVDTGTDDAKYVTSKAIKDNWNYFNCSSK